MPAIKYKERTYAGSSFPVLEMTKAEYDALSEAKKMDGTVYMITDGTGSWAAEDSTYDNTESGLTATNVQDALDELESTKADSNVSGPGYCKMPDGTLIQWGNLTLEVSGEMSQIASSGIYASPMFNVRMPLAFKDSYYVVTGIGKYSTGHNVPLSAWASGGDIFSSQVYDFYKRPLNDGLYKVRWQAIGHWK